MYFRASSFSSTCPSTRTPAWLGYQAQHDDLIVVPPSVAAFSRTRTSAPSRSALSAAEKPGRGGRPRRPPPPRPQEPRGGGGRCFVLRCTAAVPGGAPCP